MCIVQEKYFCCIEHEDDVVCYLADDQTTKNNRLIYVSADLAYFYEKSTVVSIDIESIKVGIYKVLDKNQELNTVNVEKFMTLLTHVRPIINQISKKKTELSQYLSKYKRLLKNVYDFEVKTVESIGTLSGSNEETNNYYSDASVAHQKAALQKKLTASRSVRQNIIKNMLEVQILSDNIYLCVDNVEFDTSIMLDRIIKNFNDLKKIK